MMATLFDSGHALPFRFLLNSFVNAEVCYVEALKALAGPHGPRRVFGTYLL